MLRHADMDRGDDRFAPRPVLSCPVLFWPGLVVTGSLAESRIATMDLPSSYSTLAP